MNGTGTGATASVASLRAESAVESGDNREDATADCAGRGILGGWHL